MLTKKEIVDSLSDKLIMTTYEYLKDAMPDGEKINEILDILMSSYLTGMFYSMKVVAADNDEFKNAVEEFSNALMNCISELPMIYAEIKNTKQ